MENIETAVFGGGCFWCTEAIFQNLRGVKKVTSGYAGGRMDNPSYEQVSMGNTGHAESVKIEFDPSMISYANLLEVFFATHDPTTMNQQGADVGEQYRSVIFFSNDSQEKQAKEYVTKLERTHEFENPIVTQIEKLDQFYPAEEYHQNFYKSNPDKPYCQLVINPKLTKLRKQFAKLLI